MGFILLHREIQDHWIWDNGPFSYAQAWIDLLLLANWKDSKVCYGGKIDTVKRGEVRRSKSQLAERWHWSDGKVRRFLALLESDEMARVNSTTNGTIITIENYSRFQDMRWTDEHTNDEPTTSDRRTNDEPTTSDRRHTNKNNKYNKVNKETNKGGGKATNPATRIPPTRDMVQVYVSEQGYLVDVDGFMDYYERQGWKLSNGRAMKDWQAAIRTWVNRDRKNRQNKPEPATGGIDWGALHDEIANT